MRNSVQITSQGSVFRRQEHYHLLMRRERHTSYQPTPRVKHIRLLWDSNGQKPCLADVMNTTQVEFLRPLSERPDCATLKNMHDVAYHVAAAIAFLKHRVDERRRKS